jgi:hypothetical protein
MIVYRLEYDCGGDRVTQHFQTREEANERRSKIACSQDPKVLPIFVARSLGRGSRERSVNWLNQQPRTAPT